jgi:photosystem II stability/assembly factor-like uncharacterized protein
MRAPPKFACFILAVIAANAMALPPERPTQPYYTKFHADPSGELFAEVTTGESYRSRDGGMHWSWIPELPGFKQLVRSGLDPARQLCRPESHGQSCQGVSGTVSAVDAAGNVYRCAGDRIEMSDDAGKNWEKTNSCASSSSSPDRCQYMAVQGKEIYVLGTGLYKSIDRGQHWITVKEASNGVLAGDPLTISLIGLGTGPSRTLYTTSRQISNGHGLSIQASRDGGQTWKRQTFGLPANWRFFKLARVSSDAIYFFAKAEATPDQQPGLYRTVDGVSAELLSTDADYSHWLDVQTGADGAIFIVTLSAIQRSDDGGKTWRLLGREGITW